MEKIVTSKPIAVSSDAAGYELKLHVISFLKENGIECNDFGTHNTESCDYSDYAVAACKEVQEARSDLALLFCGTGVGMSMAANKMKGIRACCCSDAFSAEQTRRHNNANVLCLGGRVVGTGLAEMLVRLFLTEEFEGGRHQRRIDKVSAIEAL